MGIFGRSDVGLGLMEFLLVLNFWLLGLGFD